MPPVRLAETIPAVPAADVGRAVDFCRDRLGFELLRHDGGFAILRRDDAVLHPWEAADESWRKRVSGEAPICSGAESSIAGTASCRLRVEGIDALFAELQPRGVLHSVSRAVETTDYGTREFATGDLDGNLVTPFERV